MCNCARTTDARGSNGASYDETCLSEPPAAIMQDYIHSLVGSHLLSHIARPVVVEVTPLAESGASVTTPVHRSRTNWLQRASEATIYFIRL